MVKTEVVGNKKGVLSDPQFAPFLDKSIRLLRVRR